MLTPTTNHAKMILFLSLASLASSFNVRVIPVRVSPRYLVNTNQVFGYGATRVTSILSHTSLNLAESNSESDQESDVSIRRVPPELEGVPIPFVDAVANSFIECFADVLVTIRDVEYTVAVPCDYSVALCYMEQNQQLVPIELDDGLMDDIFPLAESIVAEEFGEDLVLQRTPQTLTLVGELEDDEEDDQDEDEDDEDDQDEDEQEEEVEVLLTFEHRGQEFYLVRLLDPILLVGKQEGPPGREADNGGEDTDLINADATRWLLTPEESEEIMPVLEDIFLEYQDDLEGIFP